MAEDGTRIGIDLGGTKIEAVRIGTSGAVELQKRIATPRHDYDATVRAIRDLAIDVDGAGTTPVGIGIPGSISKRTGRVHNANSTWLNGRDLDFDLREALQRPLRISNDANCFALSEATDGAGAGCGIVLGVILGTGTGSGIIVNGAVLGGTQGIAGEWGHTALPRPEPGEVPGPLCWCGRHGCMEAWVSGPALAADHTRHGGGCFTAEQIADAASCGDTVARTSLQRHAHRLARGLAQVVNILDPDVIVLGGGLSKLTHLYEVLPDMIQPHIFADAAEVNCCRRGGRCERRTRSCLACDVERTC